jgi:hypothetical protein
MVHAKLPTKHSQAQQQRHLHAAPLQPSSPEEQQPRAHQHLLNKTRRQHTARIKSRYYKEPARAVQTMPAKTRVAIYCLTHNCREQTEVSTSGSAHFKINQIPPSEYKN